MKTLEDIVDELEMEVERLTRRAAGIRDAIRHLKTCKGTSGQSIEQEKPPFYASIEQRFKSVSEFERHFNTEEKCRKYLELQRWGSTPACPYCGSHNIRRFVGNDQIFKCRQKECRRKFSVTVGTIYENSKLPLTKWFLATYILCEQTKKISSINLAGRIGITQKSAWHLKRKLTQAIPESS